MHIDFSPLEVSPMEVLRLPQPELEAVLQGWAIELGAEVRRGHEVVGVEHDDRAVTVEVEDPEGIRRLTARYLVGCDGASSPVREMVGIPFPGITYPEVQRLAAVTMPEGVTALDDGGVDVAGVGRIPFGFRRTERGEFALSSADPTRLGVYTSEEEDAAYDDEEPMTVDEMRHSIRRVLGVELPLGAPLRLTRFTFHARQVERYREGRVFVAGDAAHLFPAPGAALNVDLLDAVNLGWKLGAEVHGWAPAGLLETYDEERRFAAGRTMLHTQAQVAIRRGHDEAAQALRDLFQELLGDDQPLRRLGALMAGSGIRYESPGHDHHPLIGAFVPELALTGDATSVTDLLRRARPVFLELAGRAELDAAVEPWRDRIDVVAASTVGRPADGLLIRPDGHLAWAVTVDEPSDGAAEALREAMATWFGVSRG
jgi:2-polyprenyl-6-methoxyphenol hydroxylase-like FAD-dependent oxidoreductase